MRLAIDHSVESTSSDQSSAGKPYKDLMSLSVIISQWILLLLTTHVAIFLWHYVKGSDVENLPDSSPSGVRKANWLSGLRVTLVFRLFLCFFDSD